MPENEKTRLQKFMGGGKQGYQIAFQMAWPAVMESFFIALAGMVGLADGELHRRIRGGGSRSDNAAEIHRLVYLYRHERIRICPGGETPW